MITVTSGSDTVDQGSTWTDAGATADTADTAETYGGFGETQSAGGAGGLGTVGYGGAGLLGNGGNGNTSRELKGGGGSSYTNPTLCSSVVHTQGIQTGSGKLIITIL